MNQDVWRPRGPSGPKDQLSEALNRPMVEHPQDFEQELMQ